MERKDDIGEFINEKLGSAKKVAPANLWDRIDTSLVQRRKRRGMLFFWSGLTALLVIALLIGGLTGYYNPNEAPNKDKNHVLISSEEGVDSSLKQTADASSEKNSELKNDYPLDTISDGDNATTEVDSTNKTSSSKIKTHSEKTTKTSISGVNTTRNNTSKTKTASSIIKKSVAAKNQSSYSVNATPNRKPDALSQQSGMALGISSEKQIDITGNQPNSNTDISTTYYYYNVETKEQFTSKNKAIIDSIRAFHKTKYQSRDVITPEAKINETKKPQEEVATNELALVVPEKDNNAKLPKTNFSVSGHIVPLYFGPSQTESNIDRSLETNDKKGAWNIGFGFMGNYRFNENAMISLGAYYSKMSYTNNNIFVESQVQRDTILNYLRVQNDASINTNKINTFFSGSKFGQIKQEISYVEIPLQFSYLIPKGKFEFSMMGGFSTYFLLDESLTLINEANQELLLGKATNLSTVSLSLNAGVGFNYQLTPKIALDVQPVFKYRIRTLNQGTFDGQTATFSFLTGIRYRF